MQHDDRERDAAAGAPGTPSGEQDPQETTGLGGAETEEFENAPSMTRAPDSDQPPEDVGDETQAYEMGGERSADARSDSSHAAADFSHESSAAAAASADVIAEPADEESAGPPPQEAEAYPAPPAPEPEASSAAAHSVPATQVGESTQCPRCGTENRPGVAFCRNCGQRLVAAGVATTLERPGAPQGTQACPRCGTINRAGVAFCQNCGANLRASAQPAPGYVPPTAPAGTPPPPAASAREAPSGGAVLGPLVLLVGAVGIATAWVLPFAYGDVSLWQRSFGASGGYGVAFWNGYAAIGGGIAEKAYFGFAAAAPILVALLVVLAIAGFLRATPGGLQVIGLAVAALWAVGLIAMFLMLEIAGNWSSDIVSVLKLISPAGIIFLLAGLIVLIGCATRFARS
jgi:phage FluMu protein Com